MTPDQQFQIAMEALRRGGATAGGVTGILALLVPFALFAMVFGILWLAFRRKQEQMQAQAVFHKQLLDKFSSGKEFSEFLESQGGRQFLKTLWSQGQSGVDRVLRPMRAGIVMTVVGLALLALSWSRGQAGIRFPGVLVLALGIGFLMSAAVSHRLSRRWGNQLDSGRPPDSPPVS
jgi:hypothetical protein